LNNEWENVSGSLALKPLYVSIDEIIYIEKACIYYEDGGKQGFVFIHQ